MGVHGLWQLLEGAGQPVTLESLEGKVLAVDVSIWLHQTMKGMRDKNGNPLPNAHLQGLFSRVCKLLFYRIRPIFVFDGGVPLLKKQTLAARRERKEAAHHESGKTSQKLLQNMIRRQVLQVALGQSVDSSLPLPPPTKRGPDMFELAPIPEGSRVLDEDSDPEEMRGTNPYLTYLEDAEEGVDNIDTESKDFRSLPYEIQHEFLSELKEVRKRDILRRAQNLPENADEFSNFQINKLLKQSRLTNQIETVRKEMNAKTSGAIIKHVSGKDDCFNHSVESGRIISEDSAHFVLIKGLSKARQLDKGRELAEETKDHMSNAAKEVAAITAKASSTSAAEKSEELDQFVEEPVPSTSKAADFEESDEEVVPSTSGAGQGRKSRFKGKKGRSSANHSGTRGSQRVPTQQQHVTLSSSDSEDDAMHGGTETVTVTRSQVKRGTKRPVVIDSDSNDSDVKLARVTETIQDNTVDSTGSSHSKSERASSSGAGKNTVSVPKSAVTSSTSDNNQDNPKNALELRIDPGRVKKDDIFPLEMFTQAASSPDNHRASRQQPKSHAVSSEAPRFPPALAALAAAVEEMDDDEEEDDDDDVEVIEDKTKIVEAVEEARDQSKSVSDVEMVVDEGRETAGPPEAVTVTSDEEEKEEETPGPDSEEERFAAKYQSASTSGLMDLQHELAEEGRTLRSEQGRQQRLATSITEQVNLEAQELLRLFGVPFVVSPTEAESQCAFLDTTQMTHGTITDDSDIWLFGGRRVYKNFFNVNKHVELFTYDKVQSMYGLSKDHLINLALLCGSDYTEGIPGVGPVRGLEIMAEFPGEKQEGLVAFRSWWKAAQDQLHMMPENKIREKLRDLEVKSGFPNMAVVEAYLHPAVDDSEEPFSWGMPDVDMLRDFAKAKFGWDKEKSDEVLLPVLQEMNKKQHQPRISAYFQPELHMVKKKTFTSKRMQEALTRVVEGPSKSPPLPESNVDKIRKAKEILKATNPRGRGRGRGRGGGSKFRARREVNLSESSSSESGSGSSSAESEGESEDAEGSQSESDSEEDAPLTVQKGRLMKETLPSTFYKAYSKLYAIPVAMKNQQPKEPTPSTSKTNSKTTSAAPTAAKKQKPPAPQKGKKTAATASKKKGKSDSDRGSEILRKNAERIAQANKVMQMKRKAGANVKTEEGAGRGKGGDSFEPGQGGDHINLEDYEDLGSSFSEED